MSAPPLNGGIQSDMVTSDVAGFRRLRVDVAQTGFFAGREFRSFLELNISSGATQVIKFSSTVDFILAAQSIVIGDGHIRFTAQTDGTPGGTFGTPMPVIGKNRMLGTKNRQQPYYTSNVTLSTGGTYTGGTPLEVVRVKASGATAQQSTVGGEVGTERGLPAGDYYLKLENIGNGSVTGVYTLSWEERP